MKIGDLSSATGVDVGTIRFYERAGLLAEPARQANGYRAYGREHLEGLSFVRHCRALDIPLADIKKLLDFTTSPLEDCADINLLVDEQIERVRARLKSLKALEKQLTALRAQCAQGHRARECGILGELVSAAHGEACICHS
ncbi:Cd(II)/Pb(II)-responsive transcriptional regulator [Variovorax sp. J22G21]|uniref:Cd(II)/Pb(II)-responsive transcriptional regulator n=1 Tax=Variovorax fucosicus TaxID=3053517 RepID=UPI002576F023|nr:MULTISPECIES: Cd(II)/Pb(II)-responsive transcriptional regulator [unclassified Variovorax]MDM0042023.1 Cd(II)/Pb(II)-responsive transcriptional regulator [Variovorax sp. J22R193]MDM0057106.1 Cd(II)/Pb(II)-responsive transcriptional regulator [Variovorax sp. J22G47]MDM0059793.1 Cd(II)/Pb(II)-responsive transcriptional regulator [Variovorax sp. J22G21]